MMDEPPLAPVRVLLIGMMGAGKSTVGHALGARTGWDYLDNDELVRRATGVPTPDVLREQGEVGLRAAESAALGVALAIAPPVIAGIAAGVVTIPEDCARLKAGGYIVWLRAPLPTLARRIGSGVGRPWLGADPEAALRALYAGRAERYSDVATLIIDVEGLRPDAIADIIVVGLH